MAFRNLGGSPKKALPGETLLVVRMWAPSLRMMQLLWHNQMIFSMRKKLTDSDFIVDDLISVC